jgi:hypothetical protein
MQTFDSLIEKLVTESSNLDIDLLLLMRDEVERLSLSVSPSPPCRSFPNQTAVTELFKHSAAQ